MKKKVLYHLESVIYKTFWKKRVKTFKGMYIGEECFIVGNGPSLRSEDLEKISAKYSFAANSIFKIFSETSWRPTVYMVQDAEYAKGILPQLSGVDAKHKFISINTMLKNRTVPKDYIGFLLNRTRFPSPPSFSRDFSEESEEGFTVLYSALQLAYYMGFKRVYLIGVDFNYSLTKNNMGQITENNSVASNHFFEASGKQVIGPPPNLEYSGQAFSKAQEMVKPGSFEIFNATRGGALEAFPRVDFDQIQSDQSRD